jgi:hypothetical protein
MHLASEEFDGGKPGRRRLLTPERSVVAGSRWIGERSDADTELDH